MSASNHNGQRKERMELVTLKHAVTQLVIKALQAGASTTEILQYVGAGIDGAAQLAKIEEKAS